MSQEGLGPRQGPRQRNEATRRPSGAGPSQQPGRSLGPSPGPTLRNRQLA